MKAKWFLFFFLLAAPGLAPPVAGGQTPAENGVLPQMRLQVKDPAQIRYLGLKQAGPFEPQKIKAEVVIIEIFSMYCPICQKEAAVVNRLYELIEADPRTKDKVKIIGIGTGNSSFEVEVFKDTYAIAFPLFPDEDFAIHRQIGEVRTPYFFVARIQPDGSHRLIYSKLGGFGEPAGFVEMIVKKAGL